MNGVDFHEDLMYTKCLGIKNNIVKLERELESKFKDKMLNIDNAEHYLRKINESYDSYISGLNSILEKLRPFLSKRKFKNLLDKKLQLNVESFNEEQYVQAVCELAVMGNYINRPEFNFQYEKRVTPPKDVDFSLHYKEWDINVEVKCASYQGKSNPSNSEVKIGWAGRAPTKNDADAVFNELKERLAQHEVTSSVAKSMDNNLLDFLMSTQEKVKLSKSADINVLVVCCDSAIDMQLWRGYLFGEQGLFTENSFSSHDKYDRVDYVLLTNMFNRHYRYYETNRVNNHWSLSTSFNLLYQNRFSKRVAKVICEGIKDVPLLGEVFPNYAEDFEKYLKDDADIPANESVVSKKNVLGVAWFSDKYRDKGIYHFREKEPKWIK